MAGYLSQADRVGLPRVRRVSDLPIEPNHRSSRRSDRYALGSSGHWCEQRHRPSNHPGAGRSRLERHRDRSPSGNGGIVAGDRRRIARSRAQDPRRHQRRVGRLGHGSILIDRRGIDLLVNNAGGGHREPLEQLTIDELSQAMELNFFGVARVTKAVLPAMRAARTGRVITVRVRMVSWRCRSATPITPPSSPSRPSWQPATVMREFDVYISVLEPVPVRTAFFANVGGNVDNVSDDDPYAELINRYNSRTAALGSGGQSAESVADVICEIAADPSPSCVTNRRSNRGQSLGRSLSTPPDGASWPRPGQCFIPDESTGGSTLGDHHTHDRLT